MLIGDPRTFAIECHHEPEGHHRNVFGRMCIHAAGKVLGDIAEPVCMLDVTAKHLKDTLLHLSRLDDPALSTLSDADAFNFLDRTLYLDDTRSDAELARDTERYYVFDFLTNGGESFDRTKSFVARSGRQIRLLFTDEADQFHSAHVPLALFEATISAFLSWIEHERGALMRQSNPQE